MELNNIELLLEKYFEGETSIVEESTLRNYFLSENVVEHLEKYKSVFQYYQQEQKVTLRKPFSKNSSNARNLWLSVAATAVIALGFCTYYSVNEVESTKYMALGTYENPEKAFEETQKALAMLSTNVNVGIESVQYINEFEISKKRIFKN